MSYLFIDPGLITGYAFFDDAGMLLASHQIKGIEEFGEMLEDALCIQLPQWIVYESFKVFPWVNQGGSEVEAAQVIGIIKHVARKNGIPIDSVDPKYKKIGYAWSGKRPPSNHAKSHGPDAVAHGEYWLRKKHIKEMD